MKPLSKFLLPLAVLFAVELASAQDSTRQAMAVQDSPFTPLPGWHTRKVIATTAAGGLIVGSLISSYYDWWHNNGQEFHFTSEGTLRDYSLGIDKVGHAYTSYFYFHSIANMLEWGGFTPETAFWWGVGASAFFAVSIEIGDGFSEWGFSWEDLAFNMAGLGYGVLQKKVPWFQNLGFKWSYCPSEGYTWPPHFTDHYDAHIYWLTFNMHNLLPSTVGEKWPEFVQLAVGYSVGENMTVREIAVGLDWNLEAIHTSNRDLAWLIKQLNLFHFPAPGVKIYFHRPPEWKLFLLN
jgi:hypothetical protein